jgi:hypothetical protein
MVPPGLRAAVAAAAVLVLRMLTAVADKPLSSRAAPSA